MGVLDLFSNPTIAQLSKVIDGRLAKLAKKSPPNSPIKLASSLPSGAGWGGGSGYSRDAEGDGEAAGEEETDDNKIKWEDEKPSSLSLMALLTPLFPAFVLAPIKSILHMSLFIQLWVMLILNTTYPYFWCLIMSTIITAIIVDIFYPLVGILLKWLLVGRLKPGRYPLFGYEYFRWWLGERILSIFGKGYWCYSTPLVGKYMGRAYYLMLGASIGKDVAIDPGSCIGQPELLVAGDGCRIAGTHMKIQKSWLGVYTIAL
jgi:hypothetical protein